MCMIMVIITNYADIMQMMRAYENEFPTKFHHTPLTCYSIPYPQCLNVVSHPTHMTQFSHKVLPMSRY